MDSCKQRFLLVRNYISSLLIEKIIPSFSPCPNLWLEDTGRILMWPQLFKVILPAVWEVCRSSGQHRSRGAVATAGTEWKVMVVTKMKSGSCLQSREHVLRGQFDSQRQHGIVFILIKDKMEANVLRLGTFSSLLPGLPTHNTTLVQLWKSQINFPASQKYYFI